MRKILYGWHLDGDEVRKGLFWHGGKPVRVYEIGLGVAMLVALLGFGMCVPGDKIDTTNAAIRSDYHPPTWVFAAGEG